MPTFRAVVPAIGILAELGIAVALVVTLPKPHPAQVAGTVRCASGAPVQGVWIEGFSGGSSFANLSPDDRRSAEVSYAYTLPDGGKYQVRVGCGGTPGNWSKTVLSDYVDAGVHQFVCHDAPSRDQAVTCVMQRR